MPTSYCHQRTLARHNARDAIRGLTRQSTEQRRDGHRSRHEDKTSVFQTGSTALVKPASSGSWCVCGSAISGSTPVTRRSGKRTRRVLVRRRRWAKGFASAGIAGSTAGQGSGASYGWWAAVLHDFVVPNASWIAKFISIGEILIGVALILGLFTGAAAFAGLLLNLTYMFTGSAGVNPMFMILEILLILAWRNAGLIGLDRIVLGEAWTPYRPASSSDASRTGDDHSSSGRLTSHHARGDLPRSSSKRTNAYEVPTWPKTGASPHTKEMHHESARLSRTEPEELGRCSRRGGDRSDRRCRAGAATTICGSDLSIMKGDVPEVSAGRLPGANEVGSLNETHQMNTSLLHHSSLLDLSGRRGEKRLRRRGTTGALTLPLTSAS